MYKNIVDMDDENLKTIKVFFETVGLLKKLKIVRSDVMLGDIGEFLCSVVYPGLVLMDQKTNPGFDAMLNGQKVQIKYSGSSDAKNIDLGKPDKYDILITILSRNSAHRMVGAGDAEYLFYYFSSKEVQEKFKVGSGYKLSRTKHFRQADKEFSIPA